MLNGSPPPDRGGAYRASSPWRTPWIGPPPSDLRWYSSPDAQQPCDTPLEASWPSTHQDAQAPRAFLLLCLTETRKARGDLSVPDRAARDCTDLDVSIYQYERNGHEHAIVDLHTAMKA
jgi:hypothetical protein